MSQFINKIRQQIILHSTRSPSILGCITIASTLLISKCSYLLWMTPVTQTDINKIRGLMSKFLSQNIFLASNGMFWPSQSDIVGWISLILMYNKQPYIFIGYNRSCWIYLLNKRLKSTKCFKHMYKTVTTQNTIKSHFYFQTAALNCLYGFTILVRSLSNL